MVEFGQGPGRFPPLEGIVFSQFGAMLELVEFRLKRALAVVRLAPIAGRLSRPTIRARNHELALKMICLSLIGQLSALGSALLSRLHAIYTSRPLLVQRFQGRQGASSQPFFAEAA